MPSSRPSTPATNGTASPRKIASPPSRKATPATIPAAPPLSPYQLDVPKLHSLPSEQQALYLLTFTSDLANHVESLSGDAVTEEQASLKKELLQIINLTQPAPTRVIRNNLNRCFATIFTRGNRKPLYESINDLVAILNAGKDKSTEQRTKHAALSCLGTIFETAGDSAISLSPLACTTIIKLLKGASNETAFRAAIFTALARIIKGINVPVDEELGRTIFKLARKAAESDRSLLVQQTSCNCLQQLVQCTSYLDNSNDFDKLSSSLFKTMDSACVAVRHAAASCLAAELVKSYSDSPTKDAVPKLRKPKKSKKPAPQDDDLDLPDRTSSPVSDKPATALSFGLQDLLRVLSLAYCRGGTSNRARAGIAVCYVKIFRALGESVVEANYSTIARHLFTDILAHPGWGYANKYRLFISRKFVRVILERTVGKMLGESAQLNACRFLLNDIIKDYPQAVKERPEPGKQVLTGALSALMSLMHDLDAAVGGIADICREGFLQVLQHSSYTVQIHASRALRTFVLACPQQLLPTVTICMNSVSRELNQLGGQRPNLRRCLGYAHGLAAVLSTSSRHPLYGSVDVYARVLQQATTLLKSSGSSDLRISACQLQVAWIMIGGLMSLGPNFVKIHLNQLMLLWKNALPKPLPRDHIGQRSMLELSYLSHVRECAMGSIRAFLTYNQRLLTSDISSRLSTMLENTVSFLQSLPEKKTSDDLSTRLSASLQLQDYEVMVRRRLYQCFCQLLTLSPAASLESIAQSTILPLAVASFSDVECNAPSSLSASIASATANFETVWDVGDNYGFGVTGLLAGLDATNPVDRKVQRHWTTRNDREVDILDSTIRRPINSSAEQDGMSCYLALGTADNDNEQLPNPSQTETVNAAIAVFGLCLPLQTLRVQESILEQISASLGSSTLQKDGARKSAITVNTSLALMTASRVASGEIGCTKGQLKDQAIEKTMQNLLHACLKDTDESARQLAAGAIGRLCLSAGNAFTASEVTYLTDTIVTNREPHVRAGCAVALANIHSQLGGMAAAFHMQSIVRILMSLAADTHPLVHFWAVDSLAQVADSAGLNFSGYVTSTIGLLSQLYVSDNHNPECGSLASSNMSMGLPVSAAIARGLDAVINVLGPDLQDMAKARDLIMNLVKLFSSEKTDVGILLESLRCMEHLSLYAPGLVGFAEYVHLLQSYVDNDNVEISHAALHGLFTVMRRDADEVVRTAKPGLEERLWDYLNADRDQGQIRSIFLDWLQQTGSSDPAGWILRCNTILTKTKAKKSEQPRPSTATAKDTAAPDPDLQDEEVAGFAAAAGVHKEDDGEAAPSSTLELMRWQVRLFAMDCLHSLIAIISKEAAISTEESPGEQALQGRVGDVVRIAFSASTAGVPSLRVVGLRIIEQILQMFGHTPDPDFPEAMLLEQYQAQISSALTPAFSVDSSPEMAAEAVNVCATFIATGIVTDVDRMGRILKLLVSALDSFSRDEETAAIGDLKGLSANAQVMVRIAVFSAWAELQIASGEQRYLVDVVKPHIAQLVPLWLTSLREYSRLRFEPDISQASTGTIPSHEGDLNTIYSALNRQTLLKFYQDSWLSLVDAIASLIDEDSEFVFDALDGKHISSNGEKSDEDSDVNGIVRKASGINYRDEPVAFFFVLFGLAFESLAVRSTDDDVVTRQRNLEILRALKKILRPSVSGNAVYQEVIFAETMDLLDRMVLTESLGVQSVIVEIARNLCMAHPSSIQGPQTPVNGDALSDDIEQLFELTRIIILVLAGVVPGIADSPVSARLESSEEAVGLVRTALQALVDVSDVFPAIIKTDLHATILHIFVTILGTGACQAAVAPQALPIFRRFVASIVGEGRAETGSQLHGALGRMEIILRNAQKRETASSVACEKNTLLAITILLSVAHGELPDTDPLVARFILELAECLEVPMTSRVAAGCIRTLLSVNVARRTLLQSTVTFLLTPSNLEGIDESKTLVAQTLSMFVARTTSDQRPGAMALVVSVLLGRAMLEGSKTHSETASRLLELAGADNIVFRSVLAALGGGQRELLESILKSTAKARRRSREYSNEHEPSIALKMDFGG